MSDTFLLLHSPLVGPFTWFPVSRELQRAGHSAVVPSLEAALDADSGFGEAMAAGIAEALAGVRVDGDLFMVAHSAAGFFLPELRRGIDLPMSGFIFVDARLPTDGANLFEDSPSSYVELLKSLAKDGTLPPWSEWFGEHALREALPVADLRESFLEELRPIPIALFEARMTTYKGWPEAPCGYVRLSSAYTAEAEAARLRGWPVLEADLTHLHMLVDPLAVAALILEIRDNLVESGDRP